MNRPTDLIGVSGLDQVGIDALSDGVEGGILRTRVQCLRICREGPIAVVYPTAALVLLANARSFLTTRFTTVERELFLEGYSSIRRLGAVSKDDWTKTIETGKVAHASMSLAFNK